LAEAGRRADARILPPADGRCIWAVRRVFYPARARRLAVRATKAALRKRHSITRGIDFPPGADL